MELGILSGYGDGSIHPDDALTWGQYLVMIDQAFFPETYAARVASGNTWDQAAYWAAVEEGLLFSRDFLPVSVQNLNRPILRQEAVVLLDRVLPEDSESDSYFYWS